MSDPYQKPLCRCPDRDTLVGDCPKHGSRLTFRPLVGLEGGPVYFRDRQSIARRAIRILRGRS